MQARDELMTVGQLAGRTGLSVKAIRRYEALGLIYSAGRSEGNYRLFDESALWCAQVVSTLRSLGLTIKQIDELGRAYLRRSDESIGRPRPHPRLPHSARCRARRPARRRPVRRGPAAPTRRRLTLPPGAGRIIIPRRLSGRKTSRACSPSFGTS
jgi:DNA-binding transcriptional MerR regulator